MHGMGRPDVVVVVVEDGRVAGVTVVPQPRSLDVPQLAEHAVTGLLAPELGRAALVAPRRQLQLLLLQPRQSGRAEETGKILLCVRSRTLSGCGACDVIRGTTQNARMSGLV